ncbi:MAG TPA: Xaa-Pro peptidase family protein [Spirochaetales bacterium]|nr:Xaa-Pro peptidase family protein [Spirochaetales bacterium]HRZ65668.1 Xaa-Pro peptidase family protein [Spirochaetia bacterium]
MSRPHAVRRARVAQALEAEGLAAALFEDTEGRRDQGIRYLTGQPGDALLVIAADGRSVLVAWDLNMARELAQADEIRAYSDFERKPIRALGEIAAGLGLPRGSRVELPAATPYPRYVDYVEGLPDYDLVCREGGAGEALRGMRAVKDAGEIALYRRAAELTDRLIDAIEAAVRGGKAATEADLALLIERECRSLGCEGTGFETIAAGPARSFGIHAFPAWGPGPFGSAGMSILDFGLKLEGYTTDVTMSFLRGSLGPERERMVELVLAAREAAAAAIKPGARTRDAALAVDAVFAAAGLAMPHALGHGIGLEAHEAPAIRSRADNEDTFAAGQVVAIEPGLYHPELGGIRFEDDYLVTAAGCERLTHSRIVRL